ncbi:MAG: nitroreductase family protein, partial [Desulfobulbaceae bacterium]|nr:nitroreductase family protein [Desulfobulbaceae bacterium]
MPDLTQGAGYRYWQETRLDREGLRATPRPWIRSSETFKRYPEAEKVILPRQWPERQDDFWQLLQQRRSERRYGDAPVTLSDLALLLWAAQGITAQAGDFFLRTAPSGGALYPVETYLAVQR